MFKQLLNECTVDLRLEAAEPLLVRSGTAVVRGPDMAFVRTRRGGRTEPFLPGTSLKGTLRSHAERIARTLRPNSVCAVFRDVSHSPDGCSSRIPHTHGPADYAASCPACRVFGNLRWKGRFNIADAYLLEEHRDVEPELRDGVGIDRITGGVAGGAKFDFEVLPAGVVFKTRVRLINFEAWMLGWMAYLLRDLHEGYVSVGGGTSRGFGRLVGHLDRLEIAYVGEPAALADYVPGIGTLVDARERQRYGFTEDDAPPRPAALRFERPHGALRSKAEIRGTGDILSVLGDLTPPWNSFIAQHPGLT